MYHIRKTLITTLVISALFLLIGKFAFAQPKINIIHPKEGDQIIASDSTFIYGNVWPKSSQIFVNNKPAKMYPNGSFLAVVPVEPGNFTFTCQAVFEGETKSKKRRVYIPYFLKTSTSDSIVFDSSYVFPKKDWELQPGDIFKAAVKGSPGNKVTFSIEGLVNNLPMKELTSKKRHYWGEALFHQRTNYQMSEVKGIYTGSYFIQSWDRASWRQITFKLEDDSGKVVQTTAPGKLSIDTLVIPKIGQLAKDIIKAQNGSGIGSLLYLPKGSRVWLTGKRGEHARIRISKNKQLWVKKKDIEILPDATSLPVGIVKEIRSENKNKWTGVEVLLDQKLPFKVKEIKKPTRITVTFYGIRTGKDSIRFALNDPTIQDIQWEQEEKDVYILKIDLNQKEHWGYDPHYENGIFYINIKKKPKIARWPNSPLKNIVICLDPGHNPDLGAVSASGIFEKDINFEYCSVLKNELEKKGAFVVLTHDNNNGISLQERGNLAAYLDADILLSLHFNALPDGVNPYNIRGISTYYNQLQSYRLASLLQQYLVEKTKMPSFGFYHSTLAICRTPQMISVLIEPGFLTIPVEEMLITSESYQKKVVNAIVKALEKFLKEN